MKKANIKLPIQWHDKPCLTLFFCWFFVFCRLPGLLLKRLLTGFTCESQTLLHSTQLARANRYILSPLTAPSTWMSPTYGATAVLWPRLIQSKRKYYISQDFFKGCVARGFLRNFKRPCEWVSVCKQFTNWFAHKTACSLDYYWLFLEKKKL